MVMLEEYVAAAHKALTAASFAPEVSQASNGFCLTCPQGGVISIEIFFEEGKQPVIRATGIARPAKGDYSLVLAALNALNRLPGHVRFSISTDGDVIADARGMSSADPSATPKQAALAALSAEVSALTREVALLAAESKRKLADLIPG